MTSTLPAPVQLSQEDLDALVGRTLRLVTRDIRFARGWETSTIRHDIGVSFRVLQASTTSLTLQRESGRREQVEYQEAELTDRHLILIQNTLRLRYVRA
jgi:hypothetical protein